MGRRDDGEPTPHRPRGTPSVGIKARPYSPSHASSLPHLNARRSSLLSFVVRTYITPQVTTGVSYMTLTFRMALLSRDESRL